MPRTYLVKKIFGPTIQGEGSLAGTPCAFLRFAGCNIWDGRDETKAKSGCPYCDTDFRGGVPLTAQEIATHLADMGQRWVIVSGGEPLLQFDLELGRLLKQRAHSIAIETNGTRPMPLALWQVVDHVSMSPKVEIGQITLDACDDLKVLFPHPNPAITPDAFAAFPATHRFVQPINDTDTLNAVNVAAAVAEVERLGAPWRLGLQIHKTIGVE